MCLYSSLDTCRDGCGPTKAGYVEVLEFTLFVTMFEFDGGGYFRGNKCLITKINGSVVLDLGWGNTQEDLYTIEDKAYKPDMRKLIDNCIVRTVMEITRQHRSRFGKFVCISAVFQKITDIYAMALDYVGTAKTTKQFK